MNNIKLTEILRVNKNRREKLTDKIIQEVSLEIFVNNAKLISISALPEKLYELALGFLYSEGLVLSEEEILDYNFYKDMNRINFKLDIPDKRIKSFFQTGEKTSGCGSSLSSALSRSNTPEFKPFTVNANSISNLIRKFQKSSKLFYETGGVHSCAIAKDDRIIFFAEDIGRHNAVDKVIGMAKIKNYATEDSYLISSGRISSEIVKKAVRLNFPMIISQSATTSEAINLAWKYKIYLIGFARADRFNVYTGFNKLTIL